MRRPNVEGARRILKRWYQAEALRCCRQQAATLGERLGITYRSVKVRDQKRRWGSCSEKGGLNFNYRLIMAPPSVLEYVVLHELLHRLEPNHSSRFWSLVRAHCPTYRDAIAWLKTRGPYLSV
jgi:predicted metal-dependent hydrolase